jgi:maltose alpha-D-glucosyltransferase/alpha-amylase
MGGAHFPTIGELPYLLTLAGHGFYWLRIPRVHLPTGEPAAEQNAPAGADDPAVEDAP